MIKALLFAGLALALAACAPLPTPVVRPIGGQETSPAKAGKTRTPRPHRPTEFPPPTAPIMTELSPVFPSVTPQPVLSPTPTGHFALPFSTLTPTFSAPAVTRAPTLAFATPSALPTAQSGLDCKLMWQSPPNSSTYLAGEKFSVGWNIKNVGTVTWQPGSFEFTYLAGARLSRDFNVPLKTTVGPAQTVTLSVPMKAPSNPSIYTTHWGIRQGNSFFCKLTLTIIVQ